MSPIKCGPFSNKPLSYNTRDYNKITALWASGKITDADKERGIKKAGFYCSVEGCSFIVKKAALKALGKIK